MAMDFYIIIFAGIMMFFFVMLMSMISANFVQDIRPAERRGELHGSMLSRFLMTPADTVMDEAPPVTLAEYITMKMDDRGHDLAGEFEDYAEDFRRMMCGTIGVSVNACALEISKPGCSGCVFRLGSDQNPAATDIIFFDSKGDEYIIMLRLRDGIPRYGRGVGFG